MENAQKIQLALDFIKFASGHMNLQSLPKIIFTTDNKWAKQMRSFGQYDPTKKSIVTYVDNRNMADVLRTLCHELVHHKQNEEGRLEVNSGETGSDIENEANAIAGIMLRDYGKLNSMIYESRLTEDINEYEIYCDMDGVLCDFDAQFDHYFGESVKEYIADKGIKSFENAVNEAGQEFWITMPMLAGAKELWQKIGKYGVTILSSPGEFEGAKEGKIKWIKENLRPSPKKIIFKQTGQKHTEIQGKGEEEIKKSVLIDDYGKNLKPWESIGAKGIKHSADTLQNTLDSLEEL
jgi:hypothetical protein